MQRRRRAGKKLSREGKELMMVMSILKQISEKHNIWDGKELIRYLFTHDIQGNPINRPRQDNTES